MSFDEPTYQQISAYVNGRMTENEKIAFEQQMQNDSELADFVATYALIEGVFDENAWNITTNASAEEIKNVAEQFRTDQVKQLSRKIRKIQGKTNSKTPVIPLRKKTYFYYISTAVAIAAIFALFYFSFMQPLAPTDAYEQYRDWSTLPSFQTKSSSEDPLVKARLLFSEEEYAEAYQLFSNYSENNPYNPSVEIYKGICQMELKNFEQAIITFETLQKSDTIDAHKSYWFLSLLYLNQGNTEKAINTLEIITKHPNYYNYEKAKKLLSEIQ